MRPLSREEGHYLYLLNKDPDVMTYLFREDDTPEGCQKIAKLVAEKNKYYDNRLGLFLAFTKESDSYIGWFILRPDKAATDDHTNLEIGYRLLKKAWGKGYGTEGAQALMEKGKKDFQATRFFASAMKENSASIKVMQKLGMTLEKEYIEQNDKGESAQAVLYSLTEPRPAN